MIRICQTKGADSGREFEFDQDLVRIGRMPDSDVSFDPEVDLDASGRHAEIRNEDGRYILIDAGSRNGTWLNDHRIKHAALEIGDVIELGRGGPKLKVGALRGRPGRRRAMSPTSPGYVRREPRFDPLTTRATTVARPDTPRPAPALLSEGPDFSEAIRSATRIRRRRQRATILWGAAGVVLFVAVTIVVSASVR